jgi:hypothetical protein
MSNKINRSHLLVIVAVFCLIISGCLGGGGPNVFEENVRVDEGDFGQGEDEEEVEDKDEDEKDEDEDEDEKDEDEDEDEDEKDEDEDEDEKDEDEDEDEKDDSYWILHSTVSINDKAFGPQTLIAEWVEEKGGSCVSCPQITWVNSGDKPHTITSDTGEFDSGPIGPGEQWMWTFIKPGTYDYHCSYHEDMSGTIEIVEVKESSG